MNSESTSVDAFSDELDSFFECYLFEAASNSILDAEDATNLEFHAHYIYKSDDHSLTYVPDKDAALYNELRATFLAPCNCCESSILVGEETEIDNPEIDPFGIVFNDISEARVSEIELLEELARQQRIAGEMLEKLSSSSNSEKLFRNVLIASGFDENFHDIDAIRHSRPRRGAFFVKKYEQPFSQIWYAAEISDTLHKYDEKDVYGCLEVAFSVGQLLADMRWRKEGFSEIIENRRQLDHLKNIKVLGAEARERKAREWKSHAIKTARKILKENPEKFGKLRELADEIIDLVESLPDNVEGKKIKESYSGYDSKQKPSGTKLINPETVYRTLKSAGDERKLSS